MPNDFLSLISPKNGFVFDTHTEIQNEYIARIGELGTDSANDWLVPLKYKKELSHPEKLKFLWTKDGSEDYILELSKTEDFSETYSISCKENFCYVDNLEIGTKYFWRVNNSKPNYFYTLNNQFRFIKIDGALNVRDLGGNKIKQGLIFRGSDISTEYTISYKGKQVFKNQLNIKNEVELRLEADGTRKSAVCGVNLVCLPYRPYKEVFEQTHIKGIRKIMDFFACADNYPLYIHCLGGADRTGMISMYLRAIAGEDDETILTDYELTSLSSYAYGLAEGVSATGVRSRNSDYFRELLRMLNECVIGDTLAEKLRNFLIFCGVEGSTLQKIANIII